MPKYEPSELKKLDVIVLRDAKNNEIHKVIFPNGLQAGTGDVGFNSGIVIPDSTEAPKNTSNSLYAVNGTLYYAGSALGGAGTSLTVEEVDGNPSVSSVTKIKVTNGTLTDDGSGTVTITTGGGGGGGAPSDAQYVVLTTDGDLSAERVLAVGTGLDTTDGGAGGNITISLDLTEVIASDGANRVLTSDGDGTLTAEANITYDGTTISLDDAVTVNDSGGDNDFRVESQGEDEALFVDASENKLHINKGETAFETHIANTNDVAVSVTAAGVVFNEDGHATNDFRVETDNRPYALFVDAGNDQVLILSGGSDGWDGTGIDRFQAADVAFYVSGSIGSIGTADRGTSVFGGDVQITGSLYVSDLGVGRDVVFYGEDADAIGMVWDADRNEHGTLILGQVDHGVDFIAYGETAGAVMEWDQSVDTLEIKDAKFLLGSTGGRHATTMEQNDETLNITHANFLTTKPMEVKFHGLVKDHQDAKILAAIDAQSVLANEIF